MLELSKAIRAGQREFPDEHVRCVEYEGLVLLNYTAQAQYKRDWTWLERVSRGLILSAKTGEVVARPFDKFFNFGEWGQYPSRDAHMVNITEKCDGSLVIAFYHEGQWRTATRGSFTSEHALRAGALLEKGMAQVAHRDGLIDDAYKDYTLLFEVIYPENRIVVDYGAREALVLLAIRHRRTGLYLPFFSSDHHWLAYQCGFDLPTVYNFANPEAILAWAGAIDAQHEGVVVEYSDGSRWKIKGDAYLTIHRFLAQASFKHVLDVVRKDAFESYVMQIPDEFRADVLVYRDEIVSTTDALLARIREAFSCAPVISEAKRKQFAQWAFAEHKDIAHYLFMMLDGATDGEVRDVILKREFKDRE